MKTSRLAWLVGLVLACSLGACEEDGGPGEGSGAPKFRRIRFLNASNKKVKKIEVHRVLPTPSLLWEHTVPVMPDGDADDTTHLSKAVAEALDPTRKLEVKIWVEIGGTDTPLGAVPVDTGVDNDLVTDLTILVDNHWDPGHPDAFQVTLMAGHATTDEAAPVPIVVQAKKP
jgi:hypothetical protein